MVSTKKTSMATKSTKLTDVTAIHSFAASNLISAKKISYLTKSLIIESLMLGHFPTLHELHLTCLYPE